MIRGAAVSLCILALALVSITAGTFLLVGVGWAFVVFGALLVGLEMLLPGTSKADG